MQINTNLYALASRRQLDGAGTGMAQALERLSSGLRINGAKDDAAGLAVSQRMTSNVNGMTQAARNASDGISLLQTAEGALSTLSDQLQRARQLAVQAANATNSPSDKQALQGEVQQLLQEVDRIARSTQFNGELVFSSSNASRFGDPNQLAVLDGLRSGWLEEAESLVSQYYGIEADGATLQIKLTSFTDGAGGVAARVGGMGGSPDGKVTNQVLEIDMADFTPPNLPNGGNGPFYNDRIIAHEMAHAIMGRSMNFTSMPTWFLEGAAEFIHGADERLAGDIALAGGTDPAIQSLVDNVAGGWVGDSAHYSGAYTAIRYMHDQLQVAGASGMRDLMVFLNQNAGSTLDDALENFFGAGFDTAAFVADFQANGLNFVKTRMNLADADTGAIGGANADGGAVRTAESVLLNAGSRTGDDVLAKFIETFEDAGGVGGETRDVDFQIGAHAGQTLTTRLGAMNAQALGIASVDISSNAGNAIMRIDQALDLISSERGAIGAQLNRLEAVIANLNIGTENLTASRSRIMDADYAAETASLMRSRIISQAASGMIAKANVAPSLALELLRS